MRTVGGGGETRKGSAGKVLGEMSSARNFEYLPRTCAMAKLFSAILKVL